MSWIFIISMFLIGSAIGLTWRMFGNRRARVRTWNKIGIIRRKVARFFKKKKDFEKVVYDSLVAQDGTGFFSKIAVENRIDKDEMARVVGVLKKKGLVREHAFANRRKLYLIDFLNAREERVLAFVRENGGEADFSVIMRRCRVDDNLLTKMGKKFVKMGLVLKVTRGYKTFFVLKK